MRLQTIVLIVAYSEQASAQSTLPLLPDSIVSAAITRGFASVTDAHAQSTIAIAAKVLSAMLNPKAMAKARPIAEPAGDYKVMVEGPLDRIEAQAAEHARRNQPFAVDSLSSVNRSALTLVRLTPNTSRLKQTAWDSMPGARSIVIERSGKQQNGEPWLLLHPMVLVADTATFFGVGGEPRADRKGIILNAYFDLRNLDAEEFDVVATSSTGDQRFHVSRSEMRRVR